METCLLGLSILSVLANICLCQDEIQLTYSLAEDLDTSTFVGDVATNSDVRNLVPNPDSADSLIFSILLQSEDYFTIDEKTGILRTSNIIDRDQLCPNQPECTISIQILCRDETSGFNVFITVTVNIEDGNDNAPEFVNSNIEITIPENTPRMQTVSLSPATDPDSPKNGISHYSIVSGVKEFSLRQVNESDGSIKIYLVIEEPLDRETEDAYKITLAALDKGGQSGTQTIDIKITDENDNQPEFTPSEYTTTVDETRKAGYTVLKVTAEDPDLGRNSEIVYAFDSTTQSDFGSVFHIDNKTGEITLKQKLDYETKSVYNLVVTAKEVHFETLPAEARITVTVNDMNDNPPKITISSLNPTGNIEVIENAPVGTFVAHLTTEDPDTGRGGIFSCVLQENDNNLFRLDAINSERSLFKITSNSIFNREAGDQYELRFVCSDQGTPSLTSTADIRVTILDQNDNAPEFSQQTYDVEVKENNPVGLFLIQVQASDPDFGVNGQVEYVLYTEAMTYIHVDPNSGNVTAMQSFDFEKYQTLSFGIIAKDGGESEPHMTTAILNIHIINENDEPPEFERTHFRLNVNESNPPQTKIGQLKVKPRDPSLGNVTFGFLTDTQYAYLFGIDSVSGDVYTKTDFDADDNGVHFFTFDVVVKDLAKPNLQSGAMVSVNVLDINDNQPKVDFPNEENFTVSVNSDFPRGQVVTTIRASDNDSGLNADLVYRIDSGNEDQYFTLIESTGELRSMKSLHYAGDRFFLLDITVSDQGVPPLSKSVTLRINVNRISPSTDTSRTTEIMSSNNLTIVIVVAVISGILIVILVISIVVLQRKDKIRLKQKQKRLTKLLSDQTGIMSSSSSVHQTQSFDSFDKPAYLNKEKANGMDESPPDYQIDYPLDKVGVLQLFSLQSLSKIFIKYFERLFADNITLFKFLISLNESSYIF